jgi:hypothetical protein
MHPFLMCPVSLCATRLVNTSLVDLQCNLQYPWHWCSWRLEHYYKNNCIIELRIEAAMAATKMTEKKSNKKNVVQAHTNNVNTKKIVPSLSLKHNNLPDNTVRVTSARKICCVCGSYQSQSDMNCRQWSPGVWTTLCNACEAGC